MIASPHFFNSYTIHLMIMKKPFYVLRMLRFVLLLVLAGTAAHAQLSTNTIKYKITYDQLTGRYSVFVVPDYSTPNSLNTGSNERGATAQVTIKVPKDFVVQPTSLTDVKGTWDLSSKLNGGDYGLDPNFSYYLFYKASDETDYGPFVQNTPVELFSFLSNGCFGPVGILAKADPFVAAAASQSLNVASSFYSKSGQSGNDSNNQGGGNQVPLEQFVEKLGPDTECRSDLMLTKTVNNPTPNVGSNVIFVITVTNNGPGPATGVVVKDQLPTGYTFVSDDGATTATYNETNGLWTIGSIPANTSATLHITAMVNASGIYTNYAEVSASNDLDIDSSPNNGPQAPDEDDDAQVSTVPIPVADLSVTKTDGATSYTPGTTTTYTVVVGNVGPSDVTGATFVDNIPANTTWSYTASGTPGTSGFTTSGTGNINHPLTIPKNGSITYIVTVTLPAGLTGDLVNSAAISVPFGIQDPNLSNNSVSDTDTRNSIANLGVTKTDNLSTYTPGGATTYTVVVSNAGPSTAVGASVTDQAPIGTTIGNWTAVLAGGATGSVAGAGNISQNVTIPPGGTITYTIPLSIPSGFTGNLVNTATVAAPAGVTDPTPANNSMTDTDTQNSEADLIISKSDGIATYTPGTTTNYTVVVSNAGPSNVVNAVLTDNAPINSTITNWTAVFSGGAAGTAAGSGNLNQTVSIPKDASITYTITVSTPSGRTNDLVNTATIDVPVGVTDLTPGNNTDTDTDTQNSIADLVVTKTDGIATYTPGMVTTYTVVVSNVGPSNVVAAPFTDAVPTGTTWSYTSTGTAGTGGNTPSGSLSISDALTIPSGGSITYTVTLTIPSGFTGNLVNVAEVQVPAGVTDPITSNNSATDTDTQNSSTDLAIVKTITVPRPEVGANVTFTLTVTNNGPSAATGVKVNDLLPDGYTFVSYSGTGTYTSATGLWTIGNMALNATTTLQIVATINTTGSYANLATVSGDQTDPVSTNNQSGAGVEMQLLLPKVYLQGALFDVTYSNPPTNTVVNTLMRDNLRALASFPTTSPYSYWNPTISANTIMPAVLTTSGTDAIVDWVFVELRNAADPGVIISGRSALLQRDGDIVNLDGTSPLDYRAVSGATYYVTVRHRNHLAVMSAGALALTPAGLVLDFRLPSTPTYVKGLSSINKSQVDVLQGRAMWAGNALRNNTVIYQGTSNDIEVARQEVVGATGNTNLVPFYILSGYHSADVDLNGKVIFQGSGNDVEFIYQNIIKNHPGNSLKDKNFVIQEQLPN